MKRTSYGEKVLAAPDRLSSYWKSEAPLLLLISVTGILYNVGMIANPYFQGRLIDAVENQEKVPDVLSLLGLFLAVLFVVQLSRFLKRFAVRQFAYRTTHRMRLNVYNNLMQEKPETLREENMGVLLSRAMGDVSNAVEGMRKVTTEIFDTVVLFLAYIAYLFFFDARLAAYCLIPVAVAVLLAFVLRQVLFNANAKSRKSYAQVSSRTYDLFDHALLYRVYGRDEDNRKAYEEALKEYQKTTTASTVLGDVLIPLVDTVALFGLLPLFFLAIPMVKNGDPVQVPCFLLPSKTWTTGLFSTFLSTFVLLSNKASHTARLFSSMQKGKASWKRIQPFLKPYRDYDAPQEVREDENLVLDHFSLTVDGRTLIQSLNLTLKKGETLGITGEIASGKSAFGKTFIHALPYEGRMTLFGKEVRDYSDAEIVGTVSYMGHRSDLVTDSLENNVAYGDPVDVHEMLKEVAFEKDLEEMPEKEKTIVGNEGVKLSGGQQERIALARTLAHPKPLVLLDDPFASVDIKTEKEIMDVVLPQKKDSLILFISHRLSLFPKLSKILVLYGDGRVDVGTHEELLQSSPLYRNLFALQQNSGEVIR